VNEYERMGGGEIKGTRERRLGEGRKQDLS